MNDIASVRNPEIGKAIVANGLQTNYHDLGAGVPIVLIHGSGPGVSAWTNWRLVLPQISQYARAIAPDMAGFGYTALDPAADYTLEYWLDHLTSFLDALGLDKVSFLGNSFGGMLATQFALRHPERADRIAMMGANVLSFELTPALDGFWGYEPSRARMAELLPLFPYDRSIITEELVDARFAASARPDYQAAFRSMFPAPRQKSIDALALSEEQLAALQCEALLIHGREDLVVPVDVSIRAQAAIPRSQLHIFGQCGHWVMIEHNKAFCALIRQFFAQEA